MQQSLNASDERTTLLIHLYLQTLTRKSPSGLSKRYERKHLFLLKYNIGIFWVVSQSVNNLSIMRRTAHNMHVPLT